jgi:hypothetical protein
MNEEPSSAGQAAAPVPRSDSATLPISLLIALVATIVSLLCSFLPWARFAVFTINGTDADGMITAIASGFSLALLFALIRIENRRFTTALGAALACAVSLGTYGYDLARLSHELGGKAMRNNIFGNSISVGFGLVVGAIAAGVAFTASVNVASHVHRTGDPRHPPAAWTHRHATLSGLIGATVAIAAAERVWALSIVLAIGTSATWFMVRRSVTLSALFTTLALLAATFGVAGGAYGATRSSESSTTSCSSVFTDGASVDAVRDQTTCTSDGKTTFVFTMDDACYDGTTLYYNKFGWGYSGKTWNTQGTAPKRTCTSNAKEKCSSLFADGTTTDSSWEFLSQDCFGADGTPTSVSSKIDFCQDFSTLVSNDYGWGKEGEAWHANQPKPATC